MKRVYFLGAMLLLSGCATYQATSLAALDPIHVKEYDQIESVSIGCKELSKEECEIYLGRDLTKKGYQPLQLTFFNNSEQTYIFRTSGVSLPLTDPEIVSKKGHTSTLGRVSGYTAGTLIAPIFPPALFLFLPAVVDGIRSSVANAKLDADYMGKAKEHIVLLPKSFNKTILFVSQECFTPSFELTLNEERSDRPITLKITATR